MPAPSCMWAVAGALAGAGPAFFLALVLAGGQFVWQLATLVTEDAANCLKRFRSNQLVGWMLVPRACLGLEQQDALLTAELRRQRRCAADTVFASRQPLSSRLKRPL